MTWEIEVGQELRRTKIHEMYGGQEQGGISTPAKSPDILLFSTSRGADYGYNYDGWHGDGSFHYTGEGPAGDQEFVRGNRAILEHRKANKTLRVFEQVARTTVRYIGAFQIEDSNPYHREDGPDRDGEIRSVLVFRLRPMDPAQAARHPEEPPPPAVQNVPLEINVVAGFTGKGSEPTTAKRREAELMKRYTDWLTAQGHTVCRNKINLPRRKAPLYTDVFDATTQELVEAKGSVSRLNVRLGLGQVLDYAQKVPHQTRGLLVPSEPPADLLDVLAASNVVCIYPHGTGFTRHESLPTT